jgi:hypothetical protein
VVQGRFQTDTGGPGGIRRGLADDSVAAPHGVAICHEPPAAKFSLKR